MRLYRKNNPEYYKNELNIRNEWIKNNPEYHVWNQSYYNWRLRKTAIQKLGGKCVICGIEDVRILQINHKNGGGNEEVNNSGKGNIAFYRDIVKGKRLIDDLEVRCANHNVLYEYERGKRNDFTNYQPKVRKWNGGMVSA